MVAIVLWDFPLQWKGLQTIELLCRSQSTVSTHLRWQVHKRAKFNTGRFVCVCVSFPSFTMELGNETTHPNSTSKHNDRYLCFNLAVSPQVNSITSTCLSPFLPACLYVGKHTDRYLFTGTTNVRCRQASMECDNPRNGTNQTGQHLITHTAFSLIDKLVARSCLQLHITGQGREQTEQIGRAHV